MPITPKPTTRLTLLPVERPRPEDRPAIRRYRLGRVLDDLGAAVATPTGRQAPPSGVRAP